MTWITAIDKRFINVGKIMFSVKIEWIQEHFILYAMHAACIKLEFRDMYILKIANVYYTIWSIIER